MRLTIILLFICSFTFGQTVITFGGKAVTYNSKVLREGFPPVSEKLVQWLNGEWYESEGKYYFKDKSGNDFDAEIIDFDLDLNWIARGFSYNSKAKIKQPSTGVVYTVLYAADSHKFWYSAANTPREIPVISLFQDVNYEHKIFTRHINSKSENIRGYIKDICTYESELSGDDLSLAQSYFNPPIEITTNVKWVSDWGNDGHAGTKGDPYQSIDKAREEITEGGTIYLGTYYRNDTSDFRTKTANVIGTSYCNSYRNEASNIPTLYVGTNSTFSRIIFRRNPYEDGFTPRIVDISGCAPVFYFCVFGDTKHGYTEGRNPMTINEGSSVILTDCQFKCGTSHAHGYIEIKDSSELNMNTGFTQVAFRPSGEAIVDANIDVWGVCVENYCSLFSDSSVSDIHIRTKVAYFSYVTGEEEFGSNFSQILKAQDTCNITISGNEVAGLIRISGGAPTINLENIITTSGKAKIHAQGATITTDAEFNITNCNVYFDNDKDNEGLHICEDQSPNGIKWNIDNCDLEFSGHQGDWLTMGQPVSFAYGIATIENSTITDNVDDCVPYGENYRSVIFCHGKLTLRNDTLKNQNWDGVCINRVLTINKYAGVDINVILENVIFESDINDGNAVAIYINKVGGATLTANDWICATGLTDNTHGSVLCKTSDGNDMADWTYLTGNCPE